MVAEIEVVTKHHHHRWHKHVDYLTMFVCGLPGLGIGLPSALLKSFLLNEGSPEAIKERASAYASMRANQWYPSGKGNYKRRRV